MPATGSTTAEITGDKAVIAMMESLSDKLLRKVIRAEIRKEARKTAKEIGAATPNPGLDETAHSRVRTYGSTVVGVAGYSLPKMRANQYPSNIDYLLEYGHRIVVGGTADRVDDKKAQGSRRGSSFTGQGRVVGFVPGTGAVRGVADRTGQQSAARLSQNIAAGAVKEVQYKLKYGVKEGLAGWGEGLPG